MRFAKGLRKAASGISSLPADCASRRRFPTHDSLQMAAEIGARGLQTPSTDSGARVDLLVRIKSEVSSNRGGFEWQFMRIAVNWNENTRLSQTNHTKPSA